MLLKTIAYRLGTLTIAACAVVMTGCASTTAVADSGASEADDLARGRAQLIRAFDTAWINFVASGRDREILKTQPPNKPGAAAGYIVRLADCLPAPELVAYPEEPVGLLKDILDSGEIRKMVQTTTSTREDTTYYFSNVSNQYLEAIITDIGDHYGVELEVIDVAMPPGRLPGTSMLLDGEADFVSQLNATGGVTQKMRRRVSRRFTCTMSASSQFIHVPEDSDLAGKLNSWADLEARTDVRICSGPLSTQTIRAFLPEHQVTTRYMKDLGTCVSDVADGKSDVIANPLPDLGIADYEGYKSIPTMIVAGTPLWVALEGIVCPDDGDPDTDNPCYEENPL